MTRPGGTWQNWGRTAKVRPQRVEFAATRSTRCSARCGPRPRGACRSRRSAPATASPASRSLPGVLLDLTDLTGLVSGRPRARPRHAARRNAPAPDPDAARAVRARDAEPRRHRPPVDLRRHLDRHARHRRRASAASRPRSSGATLVTADGELLVVDESQNAELLPAVALGLGALGILVEVTLQCVPAFVLHAVERPGGRSTTVLGVARRRGSRRPITSSSTGSRTPTAR